jgi:TPR repeat protein
MDYNKDQYTGQEGTPSPQDVVFFSPEMLKLADQRRRETQERLSDCRQAAESGDAQAQVQMGLNYLYGKNGVERDADKAFQWFSQTAPDDPVGRYWLAVCYDSGVGTPQDPARAV